MQQDDDTGISFEREAGDVEAEAAAARLFSDLEVAWAQGQGEQLTPKTGRRLNKDAAFTVTASHLENAIKATRLGSTQKRYFTVQSSSLRITAERGDVITSIDIPISDVSRRKGEDVKFIAFSRGYVTGRPKSIGEAQEKVRCILEFKTRSFTIASFRMIGQRRLTPYKLTTTGAMRYKAMPDLGEAISRPEQGSIGTYSPSKLVSSLKQVGSLISLKLPATPANRKYNAIRVIDGAMIGGRAEALCFVKSRKLDGLDLGFRCKDVKSLSEIFRRCKKEVELFIEGGRIYGLCGPLMFSTLNDPQDALYPKLMEKLGRSLVRVSFDVDKILRLLKATLSPRINGDVIYLKVTEEALIWSLNDDKVIKDSELLRQMFFRTEAEVERAVEETQAIIDDPANYIDTDEIEFTNLKDTVPVPLTIITKISKYTRVDEDTPIFNEPRVSLKDIYRATEVLGSKEAVMAFYQGPRMSISAEGVDEGDCVTTYLLAK